VAGGAPLELNGWQNLFGAFLLLPFAADFDIMMKSLSDGIFAIALAHLTITVSIGTMLLWFYIIRLIGASQASAFHFLVPIFGIIQSAIILNNRITILLDPRRRDFAHRTVLRCIRLTWRYERHFAGDCKFESSSLQRRVGRTSPIRPAAPAIRHALCRDCIARRLARRHQADDDQLSTTADLAGATCLT
jgi:hypothetical protein